MSEELTQDYLRYRLVYYPETGIVYWRTHQKSHLIGKEITQENKGYRRVTLNGKNYYLARLIFLYVTGVLPPDGFEVDHKNNVPSDNRWGNLRLCTRSQNAQNTRLLKESKTGIKGLTRSGEFQFTAKVGVKEKTLTKAKAFTPETEATVKQELIDWLIFHRNRLHGEFANHD